MTDVAGDRVNYTGPDESVECAYPPCSNRLRRSDFPGPQWCSKAHREATGGDREALIREAAAFLDSQWCLPTAEEVAGIMTDVWVKSERLTLIDHARALVAALVALQREHDEAVEALRDMGLNSPQGRSPEWFARRARKALDKMAVGASRPEQDTPAGGEEAWRCDECGMTQTGEHGPNTLCSHGIAKATALGWGGDTAASVGDSPAEETTR